MKTKQSFISSILVPMFVLGFVLTSTFTAHATEPISSKVTVHSTTKEINGNEWNALSYASGRIVKHIDQARMAIVQKNKTQALDNIQQGLTLAAIIENSIPPVQVDTEITSGDLVYKDTDDVTRLLVPIYNNSFRYDILAPVMKAKNESIKGAKDAVPVTLIQEGIDYSTEYLNVKTAKEFLESAQRFMQGDNMVEADRMLSEILKQSIIFENVQYEMPMSRAISLMALSERAYREGDNKKAEDALHHAADVMSDYIKTVKTKERVLLEKVRTNLNDLADIVHDQSRHASFHSKFSSLWNEMTGAVRHG